MKNYEKPVLMVNEELAEGVYAASGSNHWSVTYYDRENQTQYYRVEIGNSGVCHIDDFTQTVTLSITFAEPITSVTESSGKCSVSASGTQVTATISSTACRSNENHSFNITVSPNPDTQKITGVSVVGCSHPA